MTGKTLDGLSAWADAYGHLPGYLSGGTGAGQAGPATTAQGTTGTHGQRSNINDSAAAVEPLLERLLVEDVWGDEELGDDLLPQ